MSSIALIPARGGSKRIPRKNIKPFLGKPIIAYSIQAALNSELFDHVMVSTDDGEIAVIAKKYGASVPFYRSLENSDDFATTFDVVEEVISKFKETGYYFENLCCIYPCAPFVNVSHLVEAFNVLKDNKFDSVFPVVKFQNPIQRALKVDGKKISMAYPENKSMRSQDLAPYYFDSGQFYWLNVQRILEKSQIFTNNSGGIILNELDAHDIDDEIDWRIAELKYSLINNK